MTRLIKAAKAANLDSYAIKEAEEFERTLAKALARGTIEPVAVGWSWHQDTEPYKTITAHDLGVLLAEIDMFLHPAKQFEKDDEPR